MLLNCYITWHTAFLFDYHSTPTNMHFLSSLIALTAFTVFTFVHASPVHSLHAVPDLLVFSILNPQVALRETLNICNVVDRSMDVGLLVPCAITWLIFIIQ